jgi:hypothetical protein
VDKHDVAVLLGGADGEIVDFEESPAGLVIQHRDGTSYIHVPDDTPDADGQTGLMFLSPPDGYKGTFPVYQPGFDALAGNYDGLSKAELRAIVEDRGLDVAKNATVAQLLEALTADDEAAAALPPPPPVDPNTSPAAR